MSWTNPATYVTSEVRGEAEVTRSLGNTRAPAKGHPARGHSAGGGGCGSGGGEETKVAMMTTG
ncbi:hypothetical protein E2C01_079117 [Portunus trituberculatus]|uniref:Uncharacterized protein n=1 Tax=Portunus trituberculatus TaxID=210409 RepID=A0A5B7IQL1_PORTR|nr:hypothetical protein [Portunus trituberculatus]